VFEKRVLRRIFGTKMGEVTGEWKRLQKRSFVICAAPNRSIIRVIKSRRMRWAGQVARMQTAFWWGN
jgi:hypothetical protein